MKESWFMHETSSKQIQIPETPLNIFTQEPQVPEGPFYVRQEPIAKDGKLREIADEEVSALAHIIYNAYLEWKKQ